MHEEVPLHSTDYDPIMEKLFEKQIIRDEHCGHDCDCCRDCGGTISVVSNENIETKNIFSMHYLPRLFKFRQFITPWQIDENLPINAPATSTKALRLLAVTLLAPFYLQIYFSQMFWSDFMRLPRLREPDINYYAVYYDERRLNSSPMTWRLKKVFLSFVCGVLNMTVGWLPVLVCLSVFYLYLLACWLVFFK